jgi:hypothetical protein
MQEEKDFIEGEFEEEREEARREENAPPETSEHPVPGVKHETEPDAENIMPAQDRPGTF